MLPDDKREHSFNAVRAFIGKEEKFYGNHDVVVHKQGKTHLYKDVYVHISYYIDYRHMKVSVIWEECTSAPNYKDLDLYGEYSSNFQAFECGDGNLAWSDGDCIITIMKNAQGAHFTI